MFPVRKRPIIIGDKTIVRLTDGVNMYWYETEGHRVRWARINRVEDEPSFRTHGAGHDLDEARADAALAQRQRDEHDNVGTTS